MGEITILTLLKENPTKTFSVSELSDKVNVNTRSVHRQLAEHLKQKLVVKEQILISNRPANVYRYNLSDAELGKMYRVVMNDKRFPPIKDLNTDIVLSLKTLIVLEKILVVLESLDNIRVK